MVLVRISLRGEQICQKNVIEKKYNSNTVLLNVQTFLFTRQLQSYLIFSARFSQYEEVLIECSKLTTVLKKYNQKQSINIG
jgi:hypothetical protein